MAKIMKWVTSRAGTNIVGMYQAEPRWGTTTACLKAFSLDISQKRRAKAAFFG